MRYHLTYARLCELGRPWSCLRRYSGTPSHPRKLPGNQWPRRDPTPKNPRAIFCTKCLRILVILKIFQKIFRFFNNLDHQSTAFPSHRSLSAQSLLDKIRNALHTEGRKGCEFSIRASQGIDSPAPRTTGTPMNPPPASVRPGAGEVVSIHPVNRVACILVDLP